MATTFDREKFAEQRELALSEANTAINSCTSNESMDALFNIFKHLSEFSPDRDKELEMLTADELREEKLRRLQVISLLASGMVSITENKLTESEVKERISDLVEKVRVMLARCRFIPSTETEE